MGIKIKKMKTINFKSQFKLPILMLIVFIHFAKIKTSNSNFLKKNLIEVEMDLIKEKLESNQILREKNSKFNSEVYAKYYETESENEDTFIMNLNEGMDKCSLMICFSSLVIGFLFIAISASIFLQCGNNSRNINKFDDSTS